MMFHSDPWHKYVAEFDATVQNLTNCQRAVDPLVLSGILQHSALNLYKFGRLSTTTQPAKPSTQSIARQLRGRATTDDAVVAVTALLQRGLDQGLAARSIAAHAEHVAARLQAEWR
jgi:hypothetical protein